MRTVMRATAALLLLALGGVSQVRALAGPTSPADAVHGYVAHLSSRERSCSGVLVHPDWVLSLRSCFGASALKDVAVTLGVTEQSAWQSTVSELSVHPTLDIALARLAKRAEIAPVALGRGPDVGETLLVTGFGRTATEWVPEQLQAASVPVVAFDDIGFEVYADVTACQGDAGGPTLRVAAGRAELVGVHDGSDQAGCLDSAGTEPTFTDLRTDVLVPWIRSVVEPPPPRVAAVSRNLLADSTPTASSSAENWGWFLSQINDGVRAGVGWSSWSALETDHSEWVEFTFPNGEARQVDRVDLYPRTDPEAVGYNFPANFTIDVWTGDAWKTVVSKTNQPPTRIARRFSFPAHTTTKIRVHGTQLKLMQFAEVEAYLASNLASDADFTASSSAENWGWYLSQINDGVRAGLGWSSWSSVDTPHTEWVEFAFPDGEARRLNRVDLYPRSDPGAAGFNFPANFTIDVWTGEFWDTVVAKPNQPAVTSAARFAFPARSTTKVRIQGTQLKLMQFAEVEAYLSDNLAADATVRASSSAEQWGWAVAQANDGFRDQTGWTSWDSLETAHTESIELTFPNGETRAVSRVDIYPRIDVPVPDNNFPANFTLDVWNGSAWETVHAARNFPKPDASGARFAFDARVTNKLRFQGTDLTIMQLNEIEVYHVEIAQDLPAPVAPLPAIVEHRGYPGAEAVFSQRGVRLHKGDGHILLADCGEIRNTAPADLLLIQTSELDLPGSPDFCFKAKGASGFLTLEIPSPYFIRGDDAHRFAATVETVTEDTRIVDAERIEPRAWRSVGIGKYDDVRSATVLELRFPITSGSP